MLFSHTHNENPIKYQWWEEVKQEEVGGSECTCDSIYKRNLIRKVENEGQNLISWDHLFTNYACGNNEHDTCQFHSYK